MKVFVCNDCSPEFVELQVGSFRKYLKEPFEFIVFVCDQSISKTPEKAREVADICRSLGVEVREIPRDKEIEDHWLSWAPGYHLFDPGSGRFQRGIGGDTFNYMLQWVWKRAFPKEQGEICFCHSDVFLIEPITFSEYLKDHSLCAVIQRKESKKPVMRSNDAVGTGLPNENDLTTEHEMLMYPWEAFMLLNPRELPGMEEMIWWPYWVEGVWTDTGGPTHHYFKEHPEIKIYDIGQSGCHDDPEVDFHPARYSFFHLGNKRIFHYYSGSRWCTDMPLYWGFNQQQSDEYHAKKMAWTRKLIGL
jgi:hypothetical protein